jgi:hypothetical protein
LPDPACRNSMRDLTRVASMNPGHPSNILSEPNGELPRAYAMTPLASESFSRFRVRSSVPVAFLY